METLPQLEDCETQENALYKNNSSILKMVVPLKCDNLPDNSIISQKRYSGMERH
jgi:hypothetical protein